jgi:hypothetical protein
VTNYKICQVADAPGCGLIYTGPGDRPHLPGIKSCPVLLCTIGIS